MKLKQPIQKRLRVFEKRCFPHNLELTKLRDCDWVISLPDRMDAVRKIAREALSRLFKQ